jgi:flagellar basal-body rod protein FlgG
MGTIIELGGALIFDAGQRLEVTASNIANATTPGYKAVIPFSSFLSATGLGTGTAEPLALQSQMGPGQVRQTSNPLDLAVQGEGYFVVDGPMGPVYTRAGQFHSDADGRLVNPAGQALQASGGDVVVHSDKVEVLSDGTVLDSGEPVARIDIVRFTDISVVTRAGAGFVTDPGNIEAANDAKIGQGMLETSNVSMAREMLTMMQLQGSAETGRHLVQVYDDLLGRALSTFGQA